MSSLFFRSLFVLSLMTTLATPLFAQESVEEVDASPVVFTNDTLSVVEGNTAFVRLTADDIQETTRVRVRITPDTARSGTDYRNPGVVTVTFYKNGVNNKRIGVRTINRSGTQGERSFTASIISVNGRALPADAAETMEVTITDRGVRGTTTTTTGGVADVKGGVATPNSTSSVTNAPTQPRCVAGPSTEIEWPVGRRSQWILAGGAFGNRGSYAVGTSYHFSGFTLPVDWDKKFREVGVEPWSHLWQMDGAGPKAYNGQREYLSTEQGGVLYDLSISECPGDFNPQTSCAWLNQQAGTNIVFFRAPTTDRNFNIPTVGPLAGDNTTCELQGGKTYYMNVKFKDCFGAPWCSGGTDPTTYYDPRLPANINEQGLLNAAGSTDFIGGMIYASGLVSRTEIQRLRQIEADARQCRAAANNAQTVCGANGCVADPNAVAACDQIFNRPWRDAGR